jgi:hypothetical protein
MRKETKVIINRTSRVIVYLFILLIMSLSVIAPFEDDLTNDPTTAFENDPAQAWEAITNNPSLLSNSDVLDVAFAQDSSKASQIIESKPELLADSTVLDRFDSEVKNNVHLLNDNPNAKVTWFKEKYNIVDKGASIESYDGSEIKTGGDLSTTFTADNFPKATVLDDGTLLFNEITFSNTDTLSRTEKSGESTFIINGGFASRESSKFDEKEVFEVTNGEIAFGESKYHGFFKITRTKEGDSISSINNERFVVLRFNGLWDIEGEIFISNKVNENNVGFTLLGNTNLGMEDGTEINVKTNEKIFYVEGFNPGKICKAEYSCIINNPGLDNGHSSRFKYKNRLAFLNVQNDDKISVETPIYYSKVEVMDLREGEVRVASVDDDWKIKSEVIIGEGNDIQLKGNLAKTNFGRFDISYKQMEGSNFLYRVQHHWSSNANQKDTEYFSGKHRNSFVQCKMGIDCEERFAKNFGKIIPSKSGNSKPKTSIYISGDNAFTAKAYEQHCEEGCYILNSRDMPTWTDSERIVVTGHHYFKSDYVWRDSPEVTINDIRSGEHNPIDAISLKKAEPYQSPYGRLPDGNVERVVFSACNTVNTETDGGYKTITGRYTDLKSVQGWAGTAKLYDDVASNGVKNDYEDTIGEKPYVNSDKGIRAYYFKLENKWTWVGNHKKKEGGYKTTCIELSSGNKIACPGVQVATN